jgi:site-specific DNA recombinase
MIGGADDRIDSAHLAVAGLVRAAQSRVTEVPAEVSALTARIERLRKRLRKGDVDLTADEIEGAIRAAKAKLAELQRTTGGVGGDVRIFARLPDAAERFRHQVTIGLQGNPVEAAKARMLLRAALGDIKLEAAEDGKLWASYELRPGELIRGAVTIGSGGGILSWKSLKVKDVRVR